MRFRREEGHFAEFLDKALRESVATRANACLDMGGGRGGKGEKMSGPTCCSA